MKSQLGLGVAFSLLCALFYAIQTVLIKATLPQLPALPVVVFGQSLVALMCMLPWLLHSAKRQSGHVLATKHFPLHVLRASCSLGISYALFYAVKFISVTHALLIYNMAPLLVPLIAAVFLRKSINHRLWLPTLLGFAGVACVLHPQAGTLSPALLWAFVAAACMASGVLTVRVLGRTDSPATIAIWFFLLCLAISAIVAAFFWQPMSGYAMAIIVLIGVLYFLTQYTLIMALRYANAQLVAVTFYSSIVFAALISWRVWGEAPSMLTILGMILVIVGGLAYVMVERRSQVVIRNRACQSSQSR